MCFPRIPGARHFVLAVIASTALLVSTCGLAAPASGQRTAVKKAAKPAPTPERLLYAKLESRSLASNAGGESATRTLQVYLPPSYYTHPERRFPVIYFLHGYGDRASISTDPRGLDSLMATADMKEFIIVQPGCANTFYANSPTSGNWEDFIVKDLVDWADTNLRTIAKPSARGISGFSMGGFGAINLALRHPDVFQATYAIAPGLIDNSALKAMHDSWAGSLIANDYAAAFSPDPANPKQVQIPRFDGTPEDNAIIGKWEDGFGNLDKKITAYKALNKPLAGIGLQVGSADEYAWLVQGTALLHQILDREGIAHRFEMTEDPHTLRNELATTRIVPFFSAHLDAPQ